MKTKKILALLLTIVMLMGLMPQVVLADTTVNIDLSTVSADGTGYKCSAITVNGKTEYVVTITDSGTYTLTGTIDQPNNPVHPTHVVVSAVTADIILNGVSVSLYNFSPLSINPGSTVNLTLADGTTNTLTTAASTIATAGLYVPAGATVIIGGTGTLNAAGCFDGGAGIGGGKGNGIANAGSITINGGIINATGGWEGAGIGGGDNGNGGTITINGGTVNATGGDVGSGIGIGRNGVSGSIAIKGGTVTATGGKNGSGIGGVSIAISGGMVTATGVVAGIGGISVAISGGTVTATGTGVGIGYYSSGTNKFTGGSIKASSVSPTPSDGTSTVYFTTVTVIDKSGSKLANTNISCTIPSGVAFDSVTDGAGRLYLWLPVGNNTTVALNSGGIDYEATGDITIAGPNNLATATSVTSVNITPATVAVQKGKTKTFSAAVAGTNNPAQTVTWSVTGGVAGTSIDSTGILTVAAGETASTLAVKATSTVDSTKSGTATVLVKESSTVDIVDIDLSTVSANGTGYKCSAITVNGKTEYAVTITDSGIYTLTGTIDQTKNPVHPTHVVVSAATADIILNGVSISLYNFSPFSINPGSTVNLILTDSTTNTLTTAASTIATAGLYVPAGATVIIGGTGTLNAAGCYDGGAGIGGGKGNGIANAGSITINSGIINATGGWEGAGIGGGDNGDGGTITINGGTVNATGRDDGAGIGGGRKGAGGSIAISGGTVTATGGSESSGIGRGIGNYSSSAIKFTGGSIKANYVSTEPSNGTNKVYFTTVMVIDKSGNKLANTDISCTMPSGVTFDSVTDGAGKLYLWLAAGSNTTVALTSGGVDYKATGNITAGTNSLTAAPITVTGVTVTPSAAKVQKGNTQTFSVAVAGTNNPAQTVTWSVTGGVAGTSIDNTGILAIAEDETASTLTVKATSTVDNTKSGTATVTVTEVPPPATVVDSVTVTPATAVVQKGSIQTFSAAVTGTNNPAQTVTWAVYGNSSSGTSIDNTGLLIVAVDETVSTLTVTATSAVDNTKSGTATVTVTETPPPAPVVTGVIITPATAAVQKGSIQTFSAAVTGTNNPAQTVTWDVYGNSSSGTSIDNTGLLTVAINESANTLTVKATSTVDNTKSGTATVTVTEVPPPAPVVTGVIITPATAAVQKGNTQSFSAAVEGANNPAQTVTWSVSGNSSIDTAISSTGVLTVGADETAASLTVTATSVFDNTKSGSATITVTPLVTVSSVTVSPSSGSVQAGGTKAFAATVTGTNNPSQEVTWSVSGNTSAGTTISSSGVLTVGSDETASPLTVTATSTLDSAKYGTATVTVTHAGNNTPGNGGGGSAAAVTATSYNASVSGTDASGNAVPKTALDITINQNTASAAMKVGSEQSAGITAGGKVVITVPSIPNVTAYTIGLPAESLSNTAGQGILTLETDVGSIMLPANMLANTGAAGKNAELSIAAGDKSALPEAVKAAIGNRPLVQLALKIDGKEVGWNNPEAPVAVSIPYTPSAAELANPESIVIWYIDGSGNAVSVPNGHYAPGRMGEQSARLTTSPAIGTVTFTTTHFSNYAVGYNRVNFTDVAANDWFSKAIGFIAARKITTGTGSGNYSPDAKLTRGEFIVMLLKAYDIAPDTNAKDNFTDAGNTYYTGYLAAAKRLGISDGVGNNMFAPGKEITRQEMFTLLYNALKVIRRLPEGKEGKALSDFSDAGDITSWAKDSMTLFVKTGTVGGNGGKLSPTATTTRAEMAQVLYNLLSK